MADTQPTRRSGVIRAIARIITHRYSTAFAEGFLRGIGFGLAFVATIYLVALAISPAKAEDFTPDARTTLHADPPPGAAWFARVVIQNRIGTYNRVETLDTAHGPVSLEYTTTPPSRRNDPASADRVCVVALPDGVMAVPECLDVMEQESGEVFLVKWIGG